MRSDQQVPSAAPKRERLAFIDAAKAIGISLVVLGHSPGLPALAVVLIYSFHMPLFFLLSGFVQTATRSTLPPSVLIRRNVRTLLVPYLSFFLISLAYWLATRHLGDRAQKFAGVGIDDAFKGLFTGLSDELFVNQALWFLPCLFVCASVYLLLRKRLSALVVMLVAGACVAIWTLVGGWHTRLPWSLDIAWMAMVFYAAGDALRESRWSVMSMPLRSVLLGLPLVIVLWAIAALQLGRVDLGHALFGPSVWLYVATSVLGIAGVLLISRFIPANPVARWLSDQSLIIFGLHALFINLASGAIKFLHLGSDLGNSAAWPFVLFVWVMAVSLPASRLLARHFPFLLGRQSPKESS